MYERGLSGQKCENLPRREGAEWCHVRKFRKRMVGRTEREDIRPTGGTSQGKAASWLERETDTRKGKKDIPHKRNQGAPLLPWTRCSLRRPCWAEGKDGWVGRRKIFFSKGKTGYWNTTAIKGGLLGFFFFFCFDTPGKGR